MDAISCQMCHKTTFVETGKECKTCRMTLIDEGKDFCSKNCRKVYERLRKVN